MNEDIDIDNWTKTTDRLPDIKERFRDGTCYHGQVIGWFDQFYRDNARVTALWTHPGLKPRWSIAGADGTRTVAGPTHWRPLLARPKDLPPKPEKTNATRNRRRRKV